MKVLDVACPTCHVTPGPPCFLAPIVRFHKSRIQLAEMVDVLEEERGPSMEQVFRESL